MKVSFDITGDPITMKMVKGKLVVEGHASRNELAQELSDNHYLSMPYGEFPKGTVFIPIKSRSSETVYCVSTTDHGWQCTCPATKFGCWHINHVIDQQKEYFDKMAENTLDLFDRHQTFSGMIYTIFNDEVHINA
jgi:hypothetical protein